MGRNAPGTGGRPPLSASRPAVPREHSATHRPDGRRRSARLPASGPSAPRALPAASRSRNSPHLGAFFPRQLPVFPPAPPSAPRTSTRLLRAPTLESSPKPRHLPQLKGRPIPSLQSRSAQQISSTWAPLGGPSAPPPRLDPRPAPPRPPGPAPRPSPRPQRARAGTPQVGAKPPGLRRAGSPSQRSAASPNP